MLTVTCYDCRTKLPRHEAHLRSISLEPAAFCRACMAVRNADMAQVAASVDAVLHAPEFVVTLHAERVAS